MTETRITSRHNPRIKAAARLRDRRRRQETGQILIEGLREVARAIEAGVCIDEVLICPELCDSAQIEAILAGPAAASALRWSVAPEVFEKIAFGDRGEGLVAIAQTPPATLDHLDSVLGLAGATGKIGLPVPSKGQDPLTPALSQGEREKTRGADGNIGLPVPSKGQDPLTPALSQGERETPLLIAVLEGIEKPGNVGAVLRSADGAGVAAVIVCGAGADLFNPNAIRASLGTIFTTPVAAASADETLAWLRARAFTIVATRPDAATAYSDFNWSRRAAVILGSESRGLSDTWRQPDVANIYLPMRGTADSLNVSAAAAVIFYEARRGRTM